MAKTICNDHHDRAVLKKTTDIITTLKHQAVRIETIGVPHQILTNYGTPEQHDESIGFTTQRIRQKIEQFLT